LDENVKSCPVLIDVMSNYDRVWCGKWMICFQGE